MQLRPYQTAGAAFLLNTPRSMVLAPVGAGKTAMTLTAIQHALATNAARRVLVLAPKRVCTDVWPVEQPKWAPGCTLAVAAMWGQTQPPAYAQGRIFADPRAPAMGWRMIAPEIKPDGISWAKGMGGGVPIGAFWLSDRAVAEDGTALSSLMGPGSHGSTYGGNPLVCAASLAVLKEIRGKDLAVNAILQEVRIRETIRSWKLPVITEVRGSGLLLGVAVGIAARDFAESHLDDCAMLRVLGLSQRRIAGAVGQQTRQRGLQRVVGDRSRRQLQAVAVEAEFDARGHQRDPVRCVAARDLRAPGSGHVQGAARRQQRVRLELRGEDGHVASLFPQHPALHETERGAVGVHGSPKPPPERVTLTFPVLCSSREVWILGSSDYGAQLGAYLGMPYAFAYFFSYGFDVDQALALYRKSYRPSERYPKPQCTICVWALAADTEEEAWRLFASRERTRRSNWPAALRVKVRPST